MNNKATTSTGAYTGNADNILARHDPSQPHYTPPNYPNWSDEKWRSIYEQHDKILAIIAVNKTRQVKLKKNHELRIESETRSRTAYRLSLQEKLDKIKQEKAKKAGEYHRTTLRNVAEVKSGNTHKGMIEFEKKAKELETLDVKIVAFLWSILIFNDRQKLAKEIRKNNDNMLAITKKVMKDRNIPLEDPGLSALLATITKQERKEYLTLCK